MYIQSGHAESLYDALFDWQAPLTLWERAEKLKNLLGSELLSSRDVGDMEIKKILEAWVIGKTLTMAYHGEPCLVRVSQIASVDGQLYRGKGVRGVEVTQALFPGRRRNVFGTPFGGIMPPQPITKQEEDAYFTYRDEFFRQAMLQVENRIEHKFQLYTSICYLLVYVDLFDMHQPRYGYFALSDFAEECGQELNYRLNRRFRERWSSKIGHLFLLEDKKEGCVTWCGQQGRVQNTAGYELALV